MSKETQVSIVKLGEKILRKKAKKIKCILDNEVQQLAQDMLFNVKEKQGVGLAAPQINQSLQMFIISSYPNDRYPDAPYKEPTIIINPKIIKTSKSTSIGWEGCLSIPGIRAKVPRYNKITVKYSTIDNEKKIEKFEGFIARVFQHEYDHLKGLVFLDRVTSNKDIVSEEVYFSL